MDNNKPCLLYEKQQELNDKKSIIKCWSAYRKINYSRNKTHKILFKKFKKLRSYTISGVNYDIRKMVDYYELGKYSNFKLDIINKAKEIRVDSLEVDKTLLVYKNKVNSNI